MLHRGTDQIHRIGCLTAHERGGIDVARIDQVVLRQKIFLG
ncbi:MAG: hypothetical protein ACXVDA_12765 [Ktedonobacterales bacterium]